MRVLVFEPVWAGHRLHFVSMLLPGLVETGADVTVALGREAPGTAEYRAHLAPLLEESAEGVVAGRVRADAWIPPARHGKLSYARDALGALRQSIARARPDFLYVPTADGLSQLLGVAGMLGRRTLPRGLHSEALLLRGSFAYPAAGWRQRVQARLSWAAAAQAAPWSVLYHLDPIVYDRERRDRSTEAESGHLRLMPDPVEGRKPSPARDASRAEILRRLGVPPDGRYVGTAGLLDRRKGVDLLIRAYADARRRGQLADTDRLLLVGRPDPAIAAMLSGETEPMVRSGHVQVIDRFLDTADFVDAISAMDLVVTPYPRHIGSASIVIRAAALGRPVLGSDFGWIGYVVPRFGLGRTVNVNDPAAFAAELAQSLDDSPAYRPPEAARRFAQFHTPENFRATWTEVLRERLGLPPAPGRVTWDLVLDEAAVQPRHSGGS
jgi:glycosyltransferase involved in cell wall biosynthesis